MGGLFSKPKAPKPPVIQPPTPLPDEDALRKGRRKSIAESKARAGSRESTILASRDETLG